MMGRPKKSHPRPEPAQPEKLMIRGRVAVKMGGECLRVEVRRGMTILTREGAEAGKVAAVAFEYDRDQAAYILQCCLPESPEYRKVDLAFIQTVDLNTICLNLSVDELEKLPPWRSSETWS